MPLCWVLFVIKLNVVALNVVTPVMVMLAILPIVILLTMLSVNEHFDTERHFPQCRYAGCCLSSN
jgi:hypothetical protein